MNNKNQELSKIEKVKIEIKDLFITRGIDYLNDNYYSVDCWTDEMMEEADSYVKEQLIEDFDNYEFIDEDDFNSFDEYSKAKNELISFIENLQD